MGSRNINAVVTPDTIALNAFIYGYGGHSLVTPHQAIQQVWWTKERIHSVATREYVLSRLKPGQRAALDKPLGFGDGLTSDTYMDWILERCRRMFLILAEIGVPEQIFSVIDASWDDEDLPLPIDVVQQLAITYQIHEQLDRRFHETQFKFLLRELEDGSHFDYGAGEVVPLEYVYKLPPAVALQGWNRVHLPKKPNFLLVRRKCQLGSGLNQVTEDEFISDIEKARFIEHEHVAGTFASYTWKGNGYALSQFIGEHTLRSYIEHRNAPQYARLAKHDRYALLLEWIHCLSSAIANLHINGFYHSAVRPSNIVIDSRNHIAFSDVGSLSTFQQDKKQDTTETYNYSAPEAHVSNLSLLLKPDLMQPTEKVRVSRTGSISSRGSSDKSMSSNSSGSRKLSSIITNGPYGGFDFGFAPKIPKGRCNNVPAVNTEAADVFSLGCVFLDILTFLLRKKSGDFTRHRSSKIKEDKRRKTSRLDSSFHNNPLKVNSWMKLLEDLAFEQDDDLLRAVPHLLHLIRKMLASEPPERPSARMVRDRVYDILISYGNIHALHCAAHQNDVPRVPAVTSRHNVHRGLSEASITRIIEDEISPTETLVSDVASLAITSAPKTINIKKNVAWDHTMGIAI